MDDEIIDSGDETRADITFPCPHNKMVIAKNLLGVIAYYHEDNDASCLLMNRLDILVETISMAIIEYGTIEDLPKIRAALVCSKEARKVLYEFLSQIKGRELARVLKNVIMMYRDMSSTEMLMKELINEFNITLFSNVRLCLGIDLGSLYTARVGNKNMNPLSVYDVDPVIVVPRYTIEKKKQTLSDIINPNAIER